MMKRQSKLAALSISFILMYSSCKKDHPIKELVSRVSSPTDASSSVLPKSSTDSYVKKELLIQFKSETSAETRLAVFQSIKSQVLEEILTEAMKDAGQHNAIYRVQTSLEPKQAQSMLQGNISVAVAEPNYIYSSSGYVSNDPYYLSKDLWGVYSSSSSPANIYGSQAANAWAGDGGGGYKGAGNVGSDNVIVAVLDQGIDTKHEDLSANIWVNPKEMVDGKDNDGNGYIDDINGWDFVKNDNTVWDGFVDGLHGTHVAGTIGAVGGNGIGIAGICWKVKMISCKVGALEGGLSAANIIKAMDYVTTLKTKHQMNIVATNNSYSGDGYSALIYAAINRAKTANILVVAAAGNNGRNTDVTPGYPAAYDLSNIISVGAIDPFGDLAFFTNYGAKSVDIFAPGVYIMSTIPTGKILYEANQGTSMAAPHVTGAAALWVSAFPGSSAAGIKNAITTFGTVTPILKGKCVTGKRLNVGRFYN
jgi:subtilisin family serine protease